jgi:predicted DNA-binding protein (MmcQ/YjbR family)
MSEPAEPNHYFELLKQHCAVKPDAVEDHPWGETVYKVRGKVFTFLGMPENARITVKALAEDRDGLLALPFITVAPYVGRYGWVRVEIADDAALDLATELIDVSYAQIAGKKRK